MKNENEQNNNEKSQSIFGFSSFDELISKYPNAIDLSFSDKLKMSYKEVTDYLKSIVNDVMVTADGEKIAISDDYRHIEESSDYAKLNRRGKKEIKTYAAEIEKLVSHSTYEKEIENKDDSKIDVEKFKYYTVPVWINNRAYNVLLECGVLNEKRVPDSATRKGASNDTFTGNSYVKYIRKSGKLQVLDVAYLYNIRNRPIYNPNRANNSSTQIEVDGKEIECKNGVVEGFKNAVRQNNELIKDYNSLVQDFNNLADENDKLRQQLQNHNHGNKPNSYS